jgi:hypothetical protein
MSKATVTYAETQAVKAFLGYLKTHWAKSINPNDQFLIIAVTAWFHQESGSLSRVIGNNPFNIRTSPLQSGSRLSKNGNGHFAIFSSMAKGFEAAAYLLIHGNKAYGYQLALNALKHSGNQGANDFIAALAMSSWDAGHYGVNNWTEAYDAKTNHLLRVYLSFGGIQTKDPQGPAKGAAKARKKELARPKLPQDFNYKVIVLNYMDPYSSGRAYAKRHARVSLGVDGTLLKR